MIPTPTFPFSSDKSMRPTRSPSLSRLIKCTLFLCLAVLSRGEAAETNGTYTTVVWNWWDTINFWTESRTYHAYIGATVTNGNFSFGGTNVAWVHADGMPVQGDARYTNYTGAIYAYYTYYAAPNRPMRKLVLGASFVGGSATTVQPGDPGANTGTAATAKRQASGNWFTTILGPIELATGAESFSRPLFAFDGARPWRFALSYHSVLAASQSEVDDLGFGWSHPFQTRVRASGSDLVLESSRSRSNTFNPKPGVPGVYVSTEDAVRYDTLTVQSGGGWLLSRRDQSSLLFNGSGRLTEDRDPNGRKLVLTYTSDRLSRIEDPVSATRLDLAYDGNGRVSTLTDATSAVVSFTYTSGLLTKITNQNGKDTSFTYNADRGLLTLTDHLGNVLTTNTYDSSGRVRQQEDGIPGSPAQLSWAETALPGNVLYAPSDTAQALPLVASIPGWLSVSSFVGLNGQTVSYSYDAQGRLSSASNGTQSASVAYGADGNIASVTDPANSTTTVAPGIVVTATDRTGKVSTYTFNPDFRLRSVRNAANETTTYTYDTQGNVTSIVDPLGASVQFTYDSNGNVLTRTDEAGKVTTFTYDARNNLLTSTDPANKTTTRTYDAANNVLTVTDALSRTTTWTYDTNSLPLTMTLPGMGVYTYVYTAGRLTQVTDPNGVITKYGYNANGWLLFREDATLKRVTRTYDPVGNVLTVTNGLNQTTTYTYDHRNRQLSVTTADGAVTSYTYDHNNNVASVTDPLGKVTLRTYDGEDRLKTVTTPDPDPAQTGPGRDPLVVTFNYDDAGRLKESVAPDGKMTKYEYDGAGRLKAGEDPLGRRATTTYDTRGLPVAFSDPLSRVTTYTYDDLGRRVMASDPLNRTTTFAYDALHRLTGATDPASVVTGQGFDVDGNRTSLTNGANHPTIFGFDVGGRLTSATTPEGRSTGQTYNSRDLPLAVTEPSGEATTFAYDDAMRLSSLTDPLGVVSYTRDAMGRTLTVVEGTKTLTREYDLAGRLTKFVDGGGNVLRYSYDPIGRLTKLTYPDLKEVTYAYDAAGRLQAVTDWASRVTTYTYDDVGRLMQTQRANGTKQVRTYDAAGQLMQLREMAADGVTIIHANDAVTYDVAGQLIGETLTPALAPALYSAAQTFDRDNRLLTHNGAATSFDADGNLLSIASGVVPSSYAYDARNRLTAAGGLSYGYDAENRRVAVTDAASVTTFVVNPNASPDQVLVRTGPDGTRTFYVYGLGLLHEETGAVVRYYHYDRRGDTVALTDGAGAVTDRVGYGVYGEMVTRTGTTATPFLFNGRWGVQTDANGIYYHRARYYHPTLRRFLNQDIVLGQIAGSASLNRFAYANGNPVSLIDPFGLAAKDVLTDGEYWNQVHANVSFFAYGVLQGAFVDLPVAAAELAKLASDLGAQIMAANAIYSLVTDAEARSSLWNGIVDSWTSSQEGAMRNLGRLGGQILGAKGLSELGTLTTAAEGASSQILRTSTQQLQSKFKHAADFGIQGNYNTANGAAFRSAINQHINSPGVQVIQGTYRGTPVTHYVNPQTGLNVMSNSAGDFLSGWKLSPQQLQHVTTTGKLGGG
ncbi:MAG: colicin D domain-containing protein [Opitutaceae bacterium]|nr:colicin D domain-containing protein [Opitutaceae bacterium]